METPMTNEEKAREIAREVIVGHVGALHPAVEPITAALAAARAEALEDAAKAVEGLFFNPGDTILCGDTLDAACDAIRALILQGGDRG